MLSADKQAEIYNKTNYGDTVNKTFNYVDQWLSKRFDK